MLIRKRLLRAAATHCDAGSKRYVLDSVHVEKSTDNKSVDVVATDGHALVTFRQPAIARDDLPAVDSIALRDVTPVAPPHVNIPREAIKPLADGRDVRPLAAKKASPQAPHLAATVEIVGAHDKLMLLHRDRAGATASATVEPPAGLFPRWREAIDDVEHDIVALTELDARLLARALLAVADGLEHDQSRVRLEILSDGKVRIVGADRETGVSARAILMPME